MFSAAKVRRTSSSGVCHLAPVPLRHLNHALFFFPSGRRRRRCCCSFPGGRAAHLLTFRAARARKCCRSSGVASCPSVSWRIAQRVAGVARSRGLPWPSTSPETLYLLTPPAPASASSRRIQESTAPSSLASPSRSKMVASSDPMRKESPSPPTRGGDVLQFFRGGGIVMLCRCSMFASVHALSAEREEYSKKSKVITYVFAALK